MVRGSYSARNSFQIALPQSNISVYNSQINPIDMQAITKTVKQANQLTNLILGDILPDEFEIGIVPIHWGLEATGGYWVNHKASSDLLTHIHEIFHLTLGIRLGEYDDPWFKEGVTEYLSWLMATRVGEFTRQEFRDKFILELDTVPAVSAYALSDERIRLIGFPQLDEELVWKDESGFQTLLFRKGGQAAMLLDAYILEQTQGQENLVTLVRQLWNHYLPAFSRNQFISEMEKITGEGAETFVTPLLDESGAFTLERLERAFNLLMEYNYFESFL